MREQPPRIRHRRGLATVLLMLGCGPDVVMSSGTTGPSDETGSSGETNTSAGPGSSTLASDGTTTSEADDTAGSSSSGSEGLGLGSACDILTQQCAEGLKCTVSMQSGSPQWICVPAVDDPVGVGETCTVQEVGSGLDDCAVGAVCFNVEPRTLEGTCLDYCIEGPTDPTCEDPDTFCLIPGDASYGMWCFEVCDPRQSDCAEAQSCRPTAGGAGAFTCAIDLPGEQGAAGDPCEFLGQCGPGLICIESAEVPDCMGGTGCCSSFCDVGDDGPCLPGQQCTPWFDGELPHPIHEGLGVCSSP